MKKENIALAHWLLIKRRELKKAKDTPYERVSEEQKEIVTKVFGIINEAVAKIEAEIENLD